jgi:biopolymer transport protein ExbB
MYGIILQITQGSTNVADTVKNAVTPLTTQPTSQSLSLLELLHKGGIIMYPILILSLLAFYFFFERLIAIKKASREDTNFMNNIKDFILNMKIDAAKAFCKSTKPHWPSYQRN